MPDRRLFRSVGRYDRIARGVYGQRASADAHIPVFSASPDDRIRGGDGGFTPLDHVVGIRREVFADPCGTSRGGMQTVEVSYQLGFHFGFHFLCRASRPVLRLNDLRHRDARLWGPQRSGVMRCGSGPEGLRLGEPLGRIKNSSPQGELSVSSGSRIIRA